MTTKVADKALGWIVLLCMTAAMLCGCTKNEFKVSFEVGEDVNQAYTMIYYASDPAKGWLVDAVVALRKGHGEIKGITRLPTLVYIYGSGSQIPAVGYAERGDELKVTGKSDDPLAWKIAGNSLTDALSVWRIENLELLRKSAGENPADALALNKAIETSVRKAPSDPVSALLIALYYNRRVDPEGFDKVRGLLKDKAAERQWWELATRADLLDPTEKAPVRPDRIVVRTGANGCDTIAFGKKPVLFFYSRSSRGDHADNIKLLRELAKEASDSASRIVVNVNTDTDSLTYASAARHDSVKWAVNAWAPAGLSDPVLVNLNVRRIPWTVVMDAKGKTLYSGPDLSEGINQMRRASAP